jgi:hypothetical protein
VFDDRDELIARVADELRHTVRVRESFDERVMAEVRARPRRSGMPSLFGWLLQPRRLELSPLAFAGMAAALLIAVAVGTWELARRQPAADRQVESMRLAAEPSEVVQFVFVAPHAESVSLVGDFNGWDLEATPMVKRGAAGVWTIALHLPVGRHHYAFVVDSSEWSADPGAPRAVVDDFGTPSSVLTVAYGGDA